MTGTSNTSAAIIEAGSSIATVLKQSPLPPLESRILLMHALQLTRIQLITRDERCIDTEQAQQLSDLFRRRQLGEPIAYLVGHREFYGLQLEVTPDVLIPRPETELLVDLALQQLPADADAPLRVLDLGTGSGAIAIAIAHSRPGLQVTALDVSAASLAVAQRNAARHLARGMSPLELLQSDWYAALGQHRFDVIVSNPPYIVAGDRHLSEGDLRFEPQDALTDHADGLSALRIIVDGAPAYLKDGGWLLMEHGYDQAPAVRELLHAQSFDQIQSWQDLAGIDRVSGGRWRLPG
ncbi:protein-(glutamine-N5) methyltransferase, release factor-specific [Collimonas arenae]|uniref:Release factor glutamine methyltransferase n=1 Tax=Collimonas arenae TaxID=279058 RepID=A0A127QPY9_9BURK|nr:peptide chain release factor N(5)-glutamine methyltransferase [Collimonas arenae]AMP01772.1 (glutamine-N5) methyltransferase, release factor-specific [Collimonas arenae]AMP11672.1 protein-(glutamine-N5) methyltransferase, release factor-specific [Collimonas arenae]